MYVRMCMCVTCISSCRRKNAQKSMHVSAILYVHPRTVVSYVILHINPYVILHIYPYVILHIKPYVCMYVCMYARTSADSASLIVAAILRASVKISRARSTRGLVTGPGSSNTERADASFDRRFSILAFSRDSSISLFMSSRALPSQFVSILVCMCMCILSNLLCTWSRGLPPKYVTALLCLCVWMSFRICYCRAQLCGRSL
jgi:hypothetical protein